MASRFQSGGREKPGSGGKIIRGRRVLPPLPYSRPSSAETLLPLTVPETQAGRNPSWIRGLLSGAGKLIYSVFGSESGYSSTSEAPSEYSSDEDHDPCPIELEDHLTGFDVRETAAGGNVKSLTIVPRSETKLVIEHLLMQETFSRNECNKLVEIIRSRVQDPCAKVGWGCLNEVQNKIGNGPLRYLNQRIYGHEADTYDLRKKAVMEAKKWFEEKQLSPNRTHDQEHGVCILSPDINKYGFDTSGGSPIDMAKSYMQSLPPWRSPYFNTVGFMTPPPYKEHANQNTGSQMFPTSKATGYWDQESLDNDQENSKLNQVELYGRLSVCQASKTLAATANICHTGEDKTFKLRDGKAVEEAEKVSALTTTLEPFPSNIGCKIKPTTAMDMSDKNQDLEIPLSSQEQVHSISCQDSPILTSTAGLNNEKKLMTK